MLASVAFIVVGILMLAWSAERFVDSAAAIAANLRMPPMMIGLTIVSFGTSLPEMLVSATAAFNGDPDIGIGNVLGSNIANIGLVLGLTALIAPLAVKSQTLKREMPLLFMVTFLAFVLMADGALGRVDGVILLVMLLLVLFWLIRISLSERHDPLMQEFAESIPVDMGMGRSAATFLIALALMVISSRLLVHGSVEIARYLGVSDLVIGLTIIAVGTSLPELMASVVSALKHEADLAIGNAIGSNMFNLLSVLAMPALIHPGRFASAALLRDFPVMLAFTCALFVVSFGRKGGVINRLEGVLLVTAFAGYLYLLYLQA